MSDRKTWKSLNSQAVLLKNKIEDKLSQLSERHADVGSSDKQPLLQDKTEYEIVEVRQLLDKFIKVYDEMLIALDPSNIVDKLTAEKFKAFVKLADGCVTEEEDKYKQKRMRHELLHRNNEGSNSPNGRHRKADLHLPENKHICSSNRLIDEQVNIAIESREQMDHQWRKLKGVRMRLTDMDNRFPLINGLVQRINLRKRRDSLIISVIIGLCTFMILAYTFW